MSDKARHNILRENKRHKLAQPTITQINTYIVMPRYNQLYLSVMLFMFVGLSQIVLKIISLMKHVNPVAFSTFD